MDIFSARLKFIREKTELNQKEVAEMVGMSPQGYGKLELGTREPNLEVLAKFPMIFNESTDFLLGVTDLDSLATRYFNDYVQLSKKIQATLNRIDELKDNEIQIDPDNGSGGFLIGSNETIIKLYLESVSSDEYQRNRLYKTLLRYLETIPYVTLEDIEEIHKKAIQAVSDGFRETESLRR